MTRIRARLTRILSATLAVAMNRVNLRHPRLRRIAVATTGPVRRRDRRIPTGANAGLRINAAYSQLSASLGTTEPALQQRLVELLAPGDVFYDVGANIGFFSMLASRRVMPGGAVHAFEPVPVHVSAIRHNLSLNDIRGVEVWPVAVADRDGRQSMLVPRESTGSKLESVPTGRPSGEAIEVETVSLDALVRSGRLPAPTVIKVDVEGAEVEVVAGLRDTLVQRRPIVLCEMHGRTAAFVAAITACGYSVSVLGGGRLEAAPAFGIYLEARPV